jgi:GTP-binding protein
MAATFLKGITGPDEIFTDPIPKIAFVGRSNVGKSSLINALTSSSVARASSEPGSTQQINVYLFKNSFHIIDLPGYGFARGSLKNREAMSTVIENYLLNPEYQQKKIVLVVDASVGMTDRDIHMFEDLAQYKKDFVIAAGKVDRMNQAEYHRNLKNIKQIAGVIPVFPVSAKEKTGLEALAAELFGA